MALVLQDRVKENSLSSGTGDVVLAGAYTGFRTFASCVPNGSVVYYCIHNLAPGYQNEWEVGYGTYTLSTTTLSRTSVYSSSNAGSLVNFTSGPGGLEVFITYPADQAVYQETNGNLRLINGVIEVSVDGTAGTTLPQATFQAFATLDDYIQNNIQNLSTGANASSDFVATNDRGDDESYYIDMGINSSGFNSGDYPIYTNNSGYVFSVGDLGSNTSTLFVGSGDGEVVIHAGGWETNNVVATFGTDLSTTLEGSLDVNTTMNVGGVAIFDTYAYTGANVSSAANGTVLVTRDYVDNAVSNGFHVHTPVLVATTGNLTATYNQPGGPGDGVGATLTNSGAQAALSIDGVSMNVADRVLVWAQSTPAQNGVYVVTTVGDGSTNWVLTRASDADTYVSQSDTGLGGGDYFFVESGSTYGFSSFVCTNDGTITFGSTAITFQLFSTVPSYVVNAPLNLTGNTLSLSGTVAATNGGTGTNTVTTGDLLYGSGTNTWSKLAAGSQYQVLRMGASTPGWGAINLNNASAVSGTLPEAYGGTNNATYVTGDMLYASGVDTLAKLGPNTTTTKKFLSQTGTGSAGQAPAWAQPAATDITGLAASATTDTTNADNITSGTLANARTTASSSNGASTIVARDASGNFSANTITANLTGTASNATTLQTARNVAISGGVTGTATSFNGSADISIPVTAINASVINSGTIPNANTTASSSNGASTIVARDASGNFTANNVSATYFIGAGTALTSLNASTINSGTVPTANLGSGTANSSTYLRGDSTWAALSAPNNGTLTMAVSGTGLSGSATFTANQSGDSTFTVTSNASSANGASTLIARDASGNFLANSVQFNSFGVGTAASGTTGEIRATNNVTAYYSDERLKTKIGSIENALDKVKQIETMVYHANETAVALGYDASIIEVGVTAQSVERVQPQVVAPAPIDDKYLTVRYERLVPLLIEAIKELEAQVAELKKGR